MNYWKLVCLTIITLVLLCSNTVFAQKAEKFDIITYKAPAGWQKEVAKDAVQFGIEDKNGGGCLISMFRSAEANADSKINFNVAWENIVEKMVTLKSPLDMQPSATENGWTAESGFASYENDGVKGIVMLVTLTGGSKMVNILALMNTDAYQQPITDFLESIDLPKITTQKAAENRVPEVMNPLPGAVNTGFKFNTTNFDDGWVSTVQEDWVESVKGPTKILIHYPTKATHDYNPDLNDNTLKAWDILVSPRYSNMTNFELKSIVSWESVYFAEGDVTQNISGKRVHVVLFRKDTGGAKQSFLEFITSDKTSFEREFGAYKQSTSGWEKIEAMGHYNRFAVDPSDLRGKWSSNFSGSISYVYSDTGRSAGADTHASAENYVFGPGSVYNWDLGVASGMVGNIKFQSVKSNGKFTLPDNWKVSFSDIEGKPRTYDAYFMAVKGGRILILDGKGFGKLN